MDANLVGIVHGISSLNSPGSMESDAAREETGIGSGTRRGGSFWEWRDRRITGPWESAVRCDLPFASENSCLVPLLRTGSTPCHRGT